MSITALSTLEGSEIDRETSLTIHIQIFDEGQFLPRHAQTCHYTICVAQKVSSHFCSVLVVLQYTPDQGEPEPGWQNEVDKCE